MHKIKLWVLAGIAFVLAGCSTPVEHYKELTPKLDLAQFFNGPLKAYGVLEGRNGEVKRRFSATIIGQWEGNQGVLDETFLFDDGEVQYRCWRITKNGDDYTGTADDVVGEAKGSVSGNALNWQYTLTIDLDGEPWNFQLDDWLYLIEDGHLINRTRLQKWGITLAQLSLYIGQESELEGVTARPECGL